MERDKVGSRRQVERCHPGSKIEVQVSLRKRIRAQAGKDKGRRKLAKHRRGIKERSKKCKSHSREEEIKFVQFQLEVLEA